MKLWKKRNGYVKRFSKRAECVNLGTVFLLLFYFLCLCVS